MCVSSSERFSLGQLENIDKIRNEIILEIESELQSLRKRDSDLIASKNLGKENCPFHSKPCPLHKNFVGEKDVENYAGNYEKLIGVEEIVMCENNAGEDVDVIDNIDIKEGKGKFPDENVAYIKKDEKSGDKATENNGNFNEKYSDNNNGNSGNDIKCNDLQMNAREFSLKNETEVLEKSDKSTKFEQGNINTNSNIDVHKIKKAESKKTQANSNNEENTDKALRKSQVKISEINDKINDKDIKTKLKYVKNKETRAINESVPYDFNVESNTKKVENISKINENSGINITNLNKTKPYSSKINCNKTDTIIKERDKDTTNVPMQTKVIIEESKV